MEYRALDHATYPVGAQGFSDKSKSTLGVYQRMGTQ